jgi:hypothetical protein
MTAHQIAIYDIYVALFNAKKSIPDLFSDTQLTSTFTSIMGARQGSWHVVGITPAALNSLVKTNFIKPKHTIARGHRVDRVTTVRKLFKINVNEDKSTPYKIEDFFHIFYENDNTILMTYHENGRGKTFPEYIKIDNQDSKLFKCLAVGFSYGPKERQYLKNLAELEGFL